MAKKNYYGVRKGLTPGIYTTWDECSNQVKGFSGAEYKGFATLDEAKQYMEGIARVDDSMELPEVYAFTDGSYNEVMEEAGLRKIYGFGGFLHVEGHEDIPLQGSGWDTEYAESRNVAGEVFGAIAAMKKALELGVTEMTLFYDYEGVEKWPLRRWKTNKPISKNYVKEYDEMSQKLNVHFIHVKAHTGIPGNELADKMAKEAVGIEC